MFDQFPKTRPPLPRAIEEVYSAHYRSNREGKTPASFLSQKLESWLHRQVASDLATRHGAGDVTLELGAGTLNQLHYEPDVRTYDIVEPFKELYANSPLLHRVRNAYSDISEVPRSEQYDRITSIATLEHVCNLPEVAAQCGLLLTETGTLRAAIPSEGTFLWTLGWKLTTGLEFKFRYGLDYGLLMKHEHVNTANEIEQVLSFFFASVQCRSFGFSKSVSLYRFYECRSPNIPACREFAERRSAGVG